MGTDLHSRRQRNHGRKLKKVLFIGFLAGLVCGLLLGALTFIIGNAWKEKRNEAGNAAKKNKEVSRQASFHGNAATVGLNTDTYPSKKDDWRLVLVNESHPLDEGWKPELAEVVKDRYVDARILDAAAKMLEDAAGAGMSLYVCSAYRDYEKQREIFDSSMADRLSQGYGPLDAYEETKKTVAFPGTSEHATGLALDITSAQYVELNEKQADTEEAKWLAANSWKYGFVLRYPPEKADVTGIIYEPWHYRYVGQEAAKEMTEKNITLEEYNGRLKGDKNELE